MGDYFPIIVLLPLMVLAGLTFVVMIGRRRRTSRGAINAPAPGSPESPLFGEPEKTPKS
ncbi:MAG: hypothetical protein M3O62_03945 [Pseudomonadota bacterium]|nr:hypothetical protein [Pseudomonadota bacterium]